MQDVRAMLTEVFGDGVTLSIERPAGSQDA